MRPWILALALAASACKSSTIVDLEIAGGESLGLDYLQVRIGDRSSLANPLSSLQLVLPDDMAGAEAKLEVWGLQGPQQVAYGVTAVTPAQGDHVRARIELAPIGCDTTWCELGEVACANAGGADGTITCVQQDDGCTTWGPLEACPANAPFCSNGTCSAECSDECTTGAAICEGPAARRTCGNFDGDSCLDWSAPVACASTESCSDGVCMDDGGPTCGTAGSDCDDGDACTTMDSCDGDSCSGEPIVCDDPQPAPTCVSDTLRSTGDGTCSNGTCSYAKVDTPCSWGCVDGMCAPSAIGSAYDTTCVITGTGAPYCFGSGASTSITTEPTGVYDSLSTSRLSVACGINSSGALVCWGSTLTGVNPTMAPTGTFTQVALGFWAGCGVRTSGALACWGSNNYGHLSPLPSGTFRKVAIGEDGACAIRSDYTLACWGSWTPSGISGTFTDVSIYQYDGCAIRTDGTLACWGLASSYAPASTKFKMVSMGTGFGCGIKLDGKVECWGVDTDGQTTEPPGTFLDLAAGARHVCGITSAGALSCWGKPIQ